MSERVQLQGQWPAGAPTGTCQVGRLGDRLRIDHADPRIVIAAELLHEMEHEPNLDGVRLADGVLRIEAENRTVIYRIGEYFASINAYAAEWPD